MHVLCSTAPSSNTDQIGHSARSQDVRALFQSLDADQIKSDALLVHRAYVLCSNASSSDTDHIGHCVHLQIVCLFQCPFIWYWSNLTFRSFTGCTCFVPMPIHLILTKSDTSLVHSRYVFCFNAPSSDTDQISLVHSRYVFCSNASSSDTDQIGCLLFHRTYVLCSNAHSSDTDRIWHFTCSQGVRVLFQRLFIWYWPNRMLTRSQDVRALFKSTFIRYWMRLSE
jgi:hypothetical protein